MTTFADHPRAAQWSTRNQVTPTDVSPNSSKKYWFDCHQCPHEFDAALSKISDGKWCPYCANRKRCPLDKIQNCESCKKKCFGSHYRAEFWSIQNSVSPWEIALHTNEKFWFTCSDCPHDFESSPAAIVGRNRWCPYCGNQRRCSLDKIQSCDFCKVKCFGSHPKAQFWSKLNKLSPWQCAIGDTKKYWFDCDKCPHEINISPEGILNGNWCSFCVNQKRCPPDKIQSCDYCRPKSFGSHSKSEFWSNRNAKSPWECAMGDDKKYWFNCNNCPHEFDASLDKVSKGQWCPYCRNLKRCNLDNIENCSACKAKSFGSHRRAAFWATEHNSVSPWQCSKGDDKKYWFLCEYSHLFQASLDKVSSGKWCPYCKHKTQTLVYTWCKEWDNLCEASKLFDWCRSKDTNYHYPFDILIPNFNVIVEIDGPHHFVPVSNWQGTVEDRQQRDIYKMICSLKYGYRFIRICQADVWSNPDHWKQKLEEAAKNTKSVQWLAEDEKLYDKHQALYESKLSIDAETKQMEHKASQLSLNLN